ncbi:MAG TPA: hypothetical protein V6C65_40320 [Allocoleopsis sp.]
MGDPVLQLNDSGNWDLIYSELKTAEETANNRYRPIPDFTIPILLHSPWIAIGTNAPRARSHWWLGCRIRSIVRVPESPFNELSGDQVTVPLNAFTLFRFTTLDSAIRLKVSIPWWHRELGITIYEYTGAYSDATEDLIREQADIIRVDLARVEYKIDNPPNP